MTTTSQNFFQFLTRERIKNAFTLWEEASNDILD